MMFYIGTRFLSNEIAKNIPSHSEGLRNLLLVAFSTCDKQLYKPALSIEQALDSYM